MSTKTQKNTDLRIKKAINNYGFLVAIMLLPMLNNIPHIASIYYQYSSQFFPTTEFSWFPGVQDPINKLHAIFVVMAIDISIIYFTIKGEKYWVAFLVLTIGYFNMAYYDLIDGFEVMKTQEIISKIMLSVFNTASIYIFPHLIHKKITQEKTQENIQHKIEKRQKFLGEIGQQVQAKRSELERTTSDLEQTSSDLERKQSDLERTTSDLKQTTSELERKEELTCPYCKEFVAETTNQLNAHKGRCKQNPKNKA